MLFGDEEHTNFGFVLAGRGHRYVGRPRSQYAIEHLEDAWLFEYPRALVCLDEALKNHHELLLLSPSQVLESVETLELKLEERLRKLRLFKVRLQRGVSK